MKLRGYTLFDPAGAATIRGMSRKPGRPKAGAPRKGPRTAVLRTPLAVLRDLDRATRAVRALSAEARALAVRALRPAPAPVGRPPALSPQQVAAVRRRLAAGETAVGIARSLRISRASLYRALARG